MNRLLLYMYRIVIVPCAVCLLPFAALLNRKVRQGLALRRGRMLIPQFNEAPLWIHAASGEFEYAKAVIRELKAPASAIADRGHLFFTQFCTGRNLF